jgi:hypothetical protein
MLLDHNQHRGDVKCTQPLPANRALLRAKCADSLRAQASPMGSTLGCGKYVNPEHNREQL